VNAEQASIKTVRSLVVEPLKYRRRQNGASQTGWSDVTHQRGIGGDTVTRTRWKLEKSCMSQREISGAGRPYNRDTGKGLKANRMAEWPVVAKKSGNADGAKGPC